MVVKCVDITRAENSEWANNEATMNETLEQIKCSHLLKTLGHSIRENTKRLENKGDDHSIQQRILYMYLEFAQYRDLFSLVQAHSQHLM
jgi:hypothetical protein